MYQHVSVPAGGAKIKVNADFSLAVPDNAIVPYIEGDGTGVDITPVMIKVVDAAVAKAYGGKRRVHWMEIYAGEKSTRVYGPDVWLPDETLAILRDYAVSIKGPLTTPVGGGIRSLNVALRQQLDLYVCLRPVRYFKGVPSPVKEPEKIDMVIFRENSEDIYAGIEWAEGSVGAKKVIDFLINEMGVRKIRFPETSGIGIKPVSREGTERLVRKAHSVRDRQRPALGVARPQGQHHEIHRGRLPRLGLRARATGVRREGDRRRTLVLVQESADGPRHRRQGHDRRCLPAADPAASGGIRRDRHVEPERRLCLRRTGGAGGRHRHCTRRQHVRLDRRVRGHPRHGTQICRQGLRQSGLGNPLGGNDARAHGLARGRQPALRRVSKRRSRTRSSRTTSRG